RRRAGRARRSTHPHVPRRYPRHRRADGAKDQSDDRLMETRPPDSQSGRLARAYASIEKRAGPPCEIALVLGSGLGQLADAVKEPPIIPSGEIDGFPVSTAPGHKGQFVIGSLFGRRTVVM